jgi:hypothetical protein
MSHKLFVHHLRGALINRIADDLSKVVDRMDFSLAPEVLAYVLRAYGPVTIDAFAAPHNHVVPRFFARYGAVAAEARDAFAQDWSSGALFVLPDFHVLGNVLDRIERDNAVVVLIVPEWTHHAWWHRLWSGAWAQRRGVYEFLPGSVLVSNNEHTFFGTRFTSRVLVMRTRRARRSGPAQQTGDPRRRQTGAAVQTSSLETLTSRRPEQRSRHTSWRPSPAQDRRSGPDEQPGDPLRHKTGAAVRARDPETLTSRRPAKRSRQAT